MGNHSILNAQAHNITADDTWHALVTAELPDGISARQIKLSELLHKTERLDLILPLNDLLLPSGLLQETLALIANRSSRIALWADTDTTVEQLDTLLGVSKASKKAAINETTVALLQTLDLIVLYTPLFADGRNFSLAKHLRLQGYQGEIRAAGQFGRDQIAYLLRSGVDSFIIADEAVTDDIATAFVALPTAYSGDNASQLPMFRARA